MTLFMTLCYVGLILMMNHNLTDLDYTFGILNYGVNYTFGMFKPCV